jgi:hypothetical protein
VINMKDKMKQLASKAQAATSANAVPIHVVHKGGKWAVQQQGQASSPLSTHSTREEAVGAGKAIARQQKTELIVHRENGTIGERDSYGNESRARG